MAATAVWVLNARAGGGTYDSTFPWRIVLHTIEGSANPGMISGHSWPPHSWYQPAIRSLYQTIPFERHAFALEHPYGVETNAARALQVEIGGEAANTPNWPVQWLDNIAEDVVVPFCRFVSSQGGQIDLMDTPDAGAIGGSASAAAPQRMTEARWRAFQGICGHRHVPNNQHWDPGALDVDRIAAHAALVIGGLLVDAGFVPQSAAAEEENDLKAFKMNDGQILLQDGLSFKILPPPWDTQNAQLIELMRAGLLKADTIGRPLLEPIGDNAVNTLIRVA